MNILLLIANGLTILAFGIHAYVGDQEVQMIQPDSDPENNYQKQEKWTMTRCGWHWVSFDLLFISIGLTLINFTDFISEQRLILQIMSVYLLGNGVFWFVTILISRKFPKNFLKLGQWMLLLLLALLTHLGSMDF